MPNVEGTILKRVLPLFVVMHQIDEAKNAICLKTIEELLKKYRIANLNTSDVEVKVYFLKYDSHMWAETEELSEIPENLDDIKLINNSESGLSLTEALEILSERMSGSGVLVSEIGYYEPITYFFVDQECVDIERVEKTIKNNKWLSKSTRLLLPYDSPDASLQSLVVTSDAIFRVPDNSDSIVNFVDIIYGIKINSITHSIIAEAYFAQSGDRGIGLFRDDFDYDETDILSEKQRLYRELVVVDPIQNESSDSGPEIVSAGILIDTNSDVEEAVVPDAITEEVNDKYDEWDDEDW